MLRVGATYFVMSQTQFVTMYNLAKGDNNATIYRKMTKFHNDFFSKLSDADAVIFKEGKSQQMIAVSSENKIEPVPYIGMVRV
jgi:hypothetical protein